MERHTQAAGGSRSRGPGGRIPQARGEAPRGEGRAPAQAELRGPGGAPRRRGEPPGSSLAARWRRISAAAALAAPAIAAPAAFAADAPGAQRRAELGHLVLRECGSCHGMALRGGLGGPLLPESLEAYSSEEVAMLILDGVPGKPMPPWRGLLSREDALWIAGRLKEGFGR